MTHPLAGQSVEQARRSLAARFRAGLIDDAELDARILVGAVLELDLTGIIAAAGRRLSVDEAARLEHFARRRLAREPVSRILGVREFWGLPLQLSVATLVPRPDTETLVELALEMVGAASGRDRAIRLVDLGTGSGAILLALLSELPRACGVGTDISVAALLTARINAVELGLAERAEFVACNYASALSGAFDLILSNPPYIRAVDIAGLAPEVRDHDPRAGLDGGADGLDAYRVLIPQAVRLLAENGALVLEVGQGQHAEVEALMTAKGLTLCGPARVDLAGIQRAVAGRRIAPIKPD